MKKILLTTVAVLFGIELNAQVSVWDGSSEPWTNGSGTEADPYLIESVQNLAYLAEKTNESIYDGNEYRIMYADTCFLLTVDLDFGANAGLQWEPIGACGATWWKGRFGGNFDGGGHTVSNLTIANDIADFFGIFGYMEGGSLKNIVVDGDELHIPVIYSYTQGPSGIILGYGSNVTIENCANKTDVVWDRISMEMGGCHLGGLFGSLYNSTIIDCHNYGDITAPEVVLYYKGAFCGGIAGKLTNCDVTDCGNYGDINITKGDCFAVHIVAAGGIAGYMTGTITNCNNNGDVFFEMSVDNYEDVKSAGGIIGYTNSSFSNFLTIMNCYSISDINVGGDTNPAWAGGIIGYIADTISVSVMNCYSANSMSADNIGGIVASANEYTSANNSYYLNTTPLTNSYGTPKAESEMKTMEFVELLNNGDNIYAMDDLGFNDGYPIFAQYYSVDENATTNSIFVYPNPAENVVYVSFADDTSCQSVEIYSVDGRIVETHGRTSLQTGIDISNLNSGVYILKVNMTDGREFTERIVKE